MMLRAADKDPGELDASGPAAVAAAYFAMLEELLRASIAEVGGQSFSFRRADWPVLTDWAAPYADSAQRVRVGTLAAELLGENRHLLQMRLQWIPFIARVGQVTPEFAGRALQVLRAAARGALHGIGGMDEFMDPLSMFRNLGTPLIAYNPSRSLGRPCFSEVLSPLWSVKRWHCSKKLAFLRHSTSDTP
jgi:hypothetical protein